MNLLPAESSAGLGCANHTKHGRLRSYLESPEVDVIKNVKGLNTNLQLIVSRSGYSSALKSLSERRGCDGARHVTMVFRIRSSLSVSFETRGVEPLLLCVVHFGLITGMFGRPPAISVE
jgi:hypothetical protein